jgi:Mg-chelatase subunit ChlD
LADGVAVFDAEEGPVRLGLAAAIADAAGARVLPLAALHAGGVPNPLSASAARRAA